MSLVLFTSFASAQSVNRSVTSTSRPIYNWFNPGNGSNRFNGGNGWFNGGNGWFNGGNGWFNPGNGSNRFNGGNGSNRFNG